MSTKGKVIKCRGAVAWEKGQPLSLEEIEVAPPKAMEIRVKIVAAGVCQSDLSAWKGILRGIKFPMILGHEGSGIVESVGEGITSVKEGDHIMASYLPQCYDCPQCKSVDTNMCERYMEIRKDPGLMKDGTTRVTCKGKPIYQFIGISSYADYTVLAHGFFNKITKKAPLEKICLLSCGITTGYGGPVKVAKVKPGSTCAVFGLGAVGLGAVMGCKAQGAARIFGVDINNGKKDIAKTAGVTDFINPNEHDKPIEEILVEKTQGGCNYTFECIGNKGVISSALRACRFEKGQCVVIGVPPVGVTIDLDPFLFLKGRIMTGCFYGGFKPSEIHALIDDYLNKKLLLDEFISGVLPIEEVNKSFDNLIKGKAVKTVLTF